MVKATGKKGLDRLAIEAAGDDAVLIGGMAVNLWANAYGIDTLIPSLTDDIDFYGDRIAIEDAAKRLRAQGEDVTEYLATLDDATPNSGKLSIASRTPGDDATGIDFLSRIDGLSTDDIVSRAIPMQVEGTTVNVLHPILLLENKINNLALYPNKRNPAGIEQARLAIEIARRFLEHHAKTEDRRATLLLFERVARAAGREAACFAFKAFQLSTLSALPEDAVLRGVDPSFADIRLPQIQTHVADRQARFDALWERMETIGNPRAQRFRVG